VTEDARAENATREEAPAGNAPAENAATGHVPPPPALADRPLERSGPIFAALTGLTALAILLQAVFAGEFVDHTRAGSWLSAHNTGAYVTIGLAVVTAAYALALLREAARALAIGAAVLAVLVIAQTAIGHAITSGGHDGLLVIHIPLAMLVFGLAIWLSVKSRGLRRDAAGA
jgi:hypothetical protein